MDGIPLRTNSIQKVRGTLNESAKAINNDAKALDDSSKGLNNSVEAFKSRYNHLIGCISAGIMSKA